MHYTIPSKHPGLYPVETRQSGILLDLLVCTRVQPTFRANTTFWTLYGLARRDLVIIVPNSMGLALGLTQGLLCLLYPHQSQPAFTQVRMQAPPPTAAPAVPEEQEEHVIT